MHILHYLDSHPASSAADIGHYLEMTPANIRYHLAILEKEGAVQVSGQRQAGGSGRPILLYNLTPSTLGENTRHLLGVILDCLREEDEEDQALMERVISRAASDFQASPGNRITTFNQAVAFLNQLHYRASWKASPAGPQIELRHCPYQDLAVTHPLLCRMDEKLVSSIFDIELVLVHKREFGADPFSPCVFKSPAKGKEKGSGIEN